MRQILNIIFASTLILGASASAQAADGSQKSPFSKMSKQALEILKKTMPASIRDVVYEQQNQTSKASSQLDDAEVEEQTDSVVLFKGGCLESKNSYSWYDNGDLQKEIVSYWDESTQQDEPYRYIFYGIGGENTPEYIINGSFDSEGNEVPESKIVYDYTPYQDISNAVNFCNNNIPYTTYNWQDGKWVIGERLAPTYKNDLLMSITYYEGDGNDGETKADSLTFAYDEKGRITSETYYDKSGSYGSINFKYDDNDRLTYYGYDDKSWYIETSYFDDKDSLVSRYYELQDNNTVFTQQTTEVTKTGVYMYNEDPTAKCVSKIETYFDKEGKEIGKSVHFYAITENSVTTIIYDMAPDSTMSNVGWFSVKYDENGDDYSIVYYTSDENNVMQESCRYFVDDELIDQYTDCLTFYDESGEIYYQLYTYLHNPNATGVERICEALVHNNKIYDIMGRQTNSKHGLYIQNGKVFFKK